MEVKDIKSSYNGKEILHDVNISSDEDMIAIVGPNAAGKSTLMKCMSGTIPYIGEIYFEGVPIKSSPGHRDPRVGYLPQEQMTGNSMTVQEVILLGRVDNLKWRIGPDDRRIVEETMEELSLWDIADRRMGELSGGQVQIVSIAQALVAEPRLLLMDEPTNNLDLNRQLKLFDVISDISERRNLITVLVLHDLNLACRYCEHIVVMSDGCVHTQGKPSEVVTDALLRDVYSVEAEIVPDRDGRPRVIPYGPL